MDALTKTHFQNLHLSDAGERYPSYQYAIDITNEPVSWAYEVWDVLLKMMKTGDNHQRAIAAQLLANLAKSDPDHRMRQDLDQVILVTYDEKFVTARHSLQALWKIAVVESELKKMVTSKLSDRFKSCIVEKNCTLVRYDIIEVFRKIYNILSDRELKEKALELIDTEEDAKYRKKYLSVWKDILKDK